MPRKNNLADLVWALRQAFARSAINKKTTLATVWERPPLQTDLVLEGIPLSNFLIVQSKRSLAALRGVFEEFAELYMVASELPEETPAAFVGRRLELSKAHTRWLLPDTTATTEAVHRAFVVMMWVISNSDGEFEATIDASSLLVQSPDFTIGVRDGVLQSKFLQGSVVPVVDYSAALENYHAGLTVRSRDRGMGSLWRVTHYLPVDVQEATRMGLRILFFASGQMKDAWAYLQRDLAQHAVRKGLKPILREIANQFNNYPNPMKELYERLVDARFMQASEFFKTFPGSKPYVFEKDYADIEQLGVWYKLLRRKIRKANEHLFD